MKNPIRIRTQTRAPKNQLKITESRFMTFNRLRKYWLTPTRLEAPSQFSPPVGDQIEIPMRTEIPMRNQFSQNGMNLIAILIIITSIVCFLTFAQIPQ